MSFLGHYPLTEAASGRTPAVLGTVSSALAAPAGVYGRGVLTLLDDTFDRSCLRPWTILQPAHLPVASTAFGDLLLHEQGTGRILFLDVQAAELSLAAKDGEQLWDPLESTCRHASLSIL